MAESSTDLSSALNPRAERSGLPGDASTHAAAKGKSRVSHTTAIIKQRAERWVEVLRSLALAIFIGIPLLGCFAQQLAGRLVWTVLVAALPLFIVLAGFHRWRRICPLAFFAKLPAWAGFGGKRIIPQWLEQRYHYIPLAFFIVGLWLRLIATNGDGQAIALFFVGISLLAFLAGALYTGKTWCNYFCPVSFIEKIYTEPHGLRETPNSQCPKCTACKTNCPDINAENGYWKELEFPSKKIAYLAYPGLVLGFYVYYFLQSGTWDYYFGGRWTDEPGVWRTAFFPGSPGATAGFYFWPELPRAVAVLLTLLTFAAVSFALFSLLEPVIAKLLAWRNAERSSQRVRHLLFSIAAFTAFVCFYSFAGAPTLRLFQPMPHFALIVVVLTAAIYLARRVSRSQRAFAEETLARNIVKRWEWQDPAPKNLHEAFLIHTIRSKETQKSAERSLEIYLESVREALADGLITRNEVHRLEALRDQLQIKQADHDKVMSALDEEERALLNDPSRQISAEKRLQLENYAHALEHYLESALRPGSSAASIDEALVAKLRTDYRVTPQEHNTVLEDILGGARGIGARLSEAVAVVERAAHTVVALEQAPSPAHDFLKDILERRRQRAVDTLAKSLIIKNDQRGELISGLKSNDPAERARVIGNLRQSIVPMLADRLLLAQRQACERENNLVTLSDKLAERTRSIDPYERALALYLTGQIGTAQESSIAHFESDSHDVVRDTFSKIKSKFMSAVSINTKAISLSTVEKMIALRSTPLFSRLEPESLDRLARACSDNAFAPGAELCHDGENGDEVFILVEGSVEIVKGDGVERRLLATEKAGGFIGELAVLDPGPRSATVLAGEHGVHALRLNGAAFRNALNHDPEIAAEVMRTLAQRLRQKNG